MALCVPGQTGCDSAPPAACPAGRYSPSTGLNDTNSCSICPAGAYCPAASLAPTYCPPGTYNPLANAGSLGACVDCSAGSSCPVAGMTAPSGNCSAGYYCPAKTIFPTDSPCPPGTYSNSFALTRYVMLNALNACSSVAHWLGSWLDSWVMCVCGTDHRTALSVQPVTGVILVRAVETNHPFRVRLVISVRLVRSHLQPIRVRRVHTATQRISYLRWVVPSVQPVQPALLQRRQSLPRVRPAITARLVRA